MKSQITLLPPKGILAAAEVMTLANTPNKHLDEKWRTMTPATHVDAALRHLYTWLSGESRDPELGTSHLANASVRLLMASERELDERERIANTCPPWDDRARYTHVKESPLPAPIDPEWEAYVDGTLGKGNASEDNPKQEIAQVGDWIEITKEDSRYVVKGALVQVTGTLCDLDLVFYTWGGAPAMAAHGSYKIVSRPYEHMAKTIDSILPSQWDNMNREFLASERYDNATRNQSKGDDE